MTKMKFLLLALTAAIAISTEALPTPSETFMHSAVLDENGNYTLFWKFDAKTITFEVHVRTTGWVGFGVSPNGGMSGSDVVIGWVNPDGKAFLKDRFATGEKMPMVDPHQDWFLISGREEAGFTILKFYRDLDTKDCAYDRIITEDTQRVIWSFRNQDPSDDNDVSYHGSSNRGSKSVNMLKPAPPRESPGMGSAISVDINNDRILVPSMSRTVYYCRVFKPPNVTRKHHVIKYAPIIQKENLGIVHHIIVQGCFVANPDRYVGDHYPCFDGSMPVELLRCRYPMALWAVGTEDFYFPDETGFSLGTASDPTLWILEVHYDNPDLKSGILDSSGMRLWYTPELRRYEAGVFLLGISGSPTLTIPPGASKFAINSVCHSNCTSEWLPTEGVKVFASALHTHLLGRKVHIRQFRGDKEIDDLGRDNQFDFNYQQFRVFNPHKVIKPADTIITQCEYDSTALRTMTFGGLETKDEMCLTWALYYPKNDLSTCSSHVDSREQLTTINHPPSSSMPQDGTLSMDDFMNAMRNTTWTPSMTALLQKTQTQSNLGYICGSVELAKNFDIPESKYPTNFKFMADPERDCFPVVSAAIGHSTGHTTIWMAIVSFIAVFISGHLI